MLKYINSEMSKQRNHLVTDCVGSFLKAIDSQNRTPMGIGAYLGHKDACKILFDLANVVPARQIDPGSTFSNNREDTDTSQTTSPFVNQQSTTPIMENIRVSCFYTIVRSNVSERISDDDVGLR